MALIDKALTTLADTKAIAGIPATDTTSDALLELLINITSLSIAGYCSRIFKRGTYTEFIPASNRQALLLQQWPIASVSSIVDDGTTLVLNTDYRLDAQDKAQGQVYRENGWNGKWLVSGLTSDARASSRILTVTYIAGFYLPGDALYVAGADDSLPMDLGMVCAQMVAESYYTTKRGAYGNLKSLSEGGLSYGWGADSTSYGNLATGINDKYAVVLNRFRRAVFA